jgi:hypothetical protein
VGALQAIRKSIEGGDDKFHILLKLAEGFIDFSLALGIRG